MPLLGRPTPSKVSSPRSRTSPNSRWGWPSSKIRDGGPIAVLRDLLRSVAETLDKIDFAPLAAGFSALFSGLTGPLTGFLQGGAGGGIVTFFETTLPEALVKAGELFRFLWEAARPFLDLAKSMLPTVKLLAQILGVGLAGGMLVARVAAVAFRNVVEALTNGLLALWERCGRRRSRS